MASSRADEVAEILWELKRADKVSTFTLIARRAGFSAGANGRAMQTCLRTVKRDWPHLHWWRAVQDNGMLEKGSEQEAKLREAGFVLEHSSEKDGEVSIKQLDTHLMCWEIPEAPTGETAEVENAATE